MSACDKLEEDIRTKFNQVIYIDNQTLRNEIDNRSSEISESDLDSFNNFLDSDIDISDYKDQLSNVGMNKNNTSTDELNELMIKYILDKSDLSSTENEFFYKSWKFEQETPISLMEILLNKIDNYNDNCGTITDPPRDRVTTLYNEIGFTSDLKIDFTAFGFSSTNSNYINDILAKMKNKAESLIKEYQNS